MDIHLHLLFVWFIVQSFSFGRGLECYNCAYTENTEKNLTDLAEDESCKMGSTPANKLIKTCAIGEVCMSAFIKGGAKMKVGIVGKNIAIIARKCGKPLPFIKETTGCEARTVGEFSDLSISDVFSSSSKVEFCQCDKSKCNSSASLKCSQKILWTFVTCGLLVKLYNSY